MKGKETKYCDMCSAGKGIRCIIDYMREASPGRIKEILAESSKYENGLTPFEMSHLHEGQIEFLTQHGVTIGKEDEADKYSDLGKAIRAMLDYASRVESEGDGNTIEDIFQTVRCLNC
mmetsp:Transcript_128788/g.287903  ORF Transcript_128788/g.287903 Transcript_128788/m.287903 type:complete len:118 (+) Transcript_128788:74-427(+)